MKKICIIVILVMVALMGCQQQEVNESSSNEEKNPIVGVDLSNITYTDYNGDTIDGETFKSNDLTVINLWGTWCGPCVDEMPDLEKSYNSYKDKKVVFLGIALDSTADEVNALRDQLNITYPLIKETDETKDLISKHFDYVPVTLFVNSDGVIVEKFIAGGTDEASLNAIIEDLLNE